MARTRTHKLLASLTFDKPLTVAEAVDVAKGNINGEFFLPMCEPAGKMKVRTFQAPPSTAPLEARITALETTAAALLAALAQIDTTLTANATSSTSRPGIRQANAVLDICRDMKRRFGATPVGRAA